MEHKTGEIAALSLEISTTVNKKLIESKQQKEKLIHFESDYKKDTLIIL